MPLLREEDKFLVDIVVPEEVDVWLNRVENPTSHESFFSRQGNSK